MKPILFLLKSDFHDTNLDPSQKYYCPHCAMVEGILQYYPQLRTLLDIRYVDFARPRAAIVELVGEEHQGCPLLVVDADYALAADFQSVGQLRLSNDKMKIATFLSQQFGLGRWHP